MLLIPYRFYKCPFNPRQSISLQMPEMSAASELKENKELIGTGSIFLLQNLGILTGFGVILVLAVFGGHIEAEIRGHD